MTAFDQAWTLLKQRGFEVDPRYEDERLQRLEQGHDKKDELKDKLRDIHSQLQASDYGSNELSAERYNLENELYQLMRNPEGTRYGDPPMNMIEAQTGPMFQEQQRRAAEEIEAEGIDLPDGPRVSAVPPANIGMAGSLSPEPTFNPFDPNEVALMRQTLANQQTPMGQALARVRAGSGPQPLQFDQ